MNEIPKIVFSRTGLDDVSTTRGLEDATRLVGAGNAPVSAATAESWRNPTICHGDLADEIARLKQQDGKPLLAHGGARFAQSLVRQGLVDEYQLMVQPVALGRGLPLFSQLETPLDLKRVSATEFQSGTVARFYRPA
jgi:dihydrofolate reductase